MDSRPTEGRPMELLSLDRFLRGHPGGAAAFGRANSSYVLTCQVSDSIKFVFHTYQAL